MGCRLWADAAPCFNYLIHFKAKFDRDGVYVKKWVPELKDVSKFIHKPWELDDKNILKLGLVIHFQAYP